MKVFLAYASKYSPDVERSMPLGLMYLASYLRMNRGCEVRLADMQLPGVAIENVLGEARKFGPDFIGISGMTPDARVISDAAARFKAFFPEVPVCVGGPHATNSPDELMEDNPAADYLIRGEGEIALAALAEHIDGGRRLEDVGNLHWRRDGEIVRNLASPLIESLDAVPFPAFDLIDLESYHRIQRCGVIWARRRYASIVSSRGCPYRCTFCHATLGKKWRPRSPRNLVDEMADLVERFRVGEFVFMDDMFNLDPERVNAIAREIIGRPLDVRLSFPIGLRADIMTEEGVRLLKQAGMFRCMYAVESGSERIQQLVRKNLHLDRVLHIIDYTQRQGVLVHGTFMLGFPTETEEEARSTISLAVRSRLHTAAFFRVIPYKGTALYEQIRELGIAIRQGYEDYEFHMANTVNASTIPDRALGRLKRAAYRRFYLSPARLIRTLSLLPNPHRMLPTLFRIWLKKAWVW